MRTDDGQRAPTAPGGSRSELFVACLPGLEPLLVDELSGLGLAGAPAEGGVELAGSLRDAARICLCSGLGTHVLVRLAEFHCVHLRELRRLAERVEWGRWLTPGEPFAVRASCRKSRLYHSGAVAERIGAAVGAALGVAAEDAIAAADDGAPAVVARLLHDRCTVSLDVSGAPLHRRGWRLAAAKAPLREDLAWALVSASGWRPGEPFVDPFCGSGTLPITAALRAAGLPPGLGRSFAFERLACAAAAGCDALRAEVGTAGPGEAARIGAADRDAGAIAAARANAARAGVADRIEWCEGSWRDAPGLADPAPAGALVSNPPFGARVGEAARLVHLWQAVGARCRALPPGWRIALLAADRRLALRTGLPLRTAFATQHGGLPVRALVARVAAPGGPGAG
ncbi:MAG: class I SAM-dependent RNA methyltransferase [Planctomycetes bacterium]|nr:class I SAM-dependent RNA methyltransferase [Planctomycetota bacterium]